MQDEEQLFTDPELMKTIRRELSEIERRKQEKMKRSMLDCSSVLERKDRHFYLDEQQYSNISNRVYLVEWYSKRYAKDWFKDYEWSIVGFVEVDKSLSDQFLQLSASIFKCPDACWEEVCSQLASVHLMSESLFRSINILDLQSLGNLFVELKRNLSVGSLQSVKQGGRNS